MGTALCWGAYARACRARTSRVKAAILTGERLKRKDIILLAAACIATVVAIVTTGVMKP